MDKLVKVLLRIEEDSFFKLMAAEYGMRTTTSTADNAKRHKKGMAIPVADMVRFDYVAFPSFFVLVEASLLI